MSEKGFIIGSRWNRAMEGAGEVTVSEKGDLEGGRSPPSHREEPGPFSCQIRAWGAERGAGRPGGLLPLRCCSQESGGGGACRSVRPTVRKKSWPWSRA